MTPLLVSLALLAPPGGPPAAPDAPPAGDKPAE